MKKTKPENIHGKDQKINSNGVKIAEPEAVVVGQNDSVKKIIGLELREGINPNAIEIAEPEAVVVGQNDSVEKIIVTEPGEIIEKHELDAWVPRTLLGRKVKNKEITNLDLILEKGLKIFEHEIVSFLIPIKTELLDIGQAKGKFGGGKRRVWKQTQRKTAEGNVPTFACMAAVGDENGHLGLGYGKAKETLPAREKAIRQAEIHIMNVKRGCGSFDCNCDKLHSLAVRVKGKCGSVVVELFPAPQGTGLVIGDEGKKILRLAGIKDAYSRVSGQGRNTTNVAKAILHALKTTQEIQ